MIDYNPEHMWTIAEHYDGYIPCFWGDSEDWSYARTLDNGYVQEVAEKKVISNNFPQQDITIGKKVVIS